MARDPLYCRPHFNITLITFSMRTMIKHACQRVPDDFRHRSVRRDRSGAGARAPKHVRNADLAYGAFTSMTVAFSASL
jgi:hypothetical protein